MSTYTNFCCRSGGSNLNAGTRTGDATEPATAPALTYASGSWVQSTGVFTVASGDPVADGVAVGDFVSVYADGATVTGCVARVTARTTTTITVSGTALSGSKPADGTGNRTLRVGGAWAGPSGASAFPFTVISNNSTNAANNPVRVNLKNDQVYSISALITLTVACPKAVQGYAASYGDGGRAVIDGGTSGASYNLVSLTASASCDLIADLEFTHNGATGSASGVLNDSNNVWFSRCVVHDVCGSGFASSMRAGYVECEAYACNQSNTASKGAFSVAGNAAAFVRCIAHDNTTSNTRGFNLTCAATAVGCIADTNGASGFYCSSVSLPYHLIGCDSYNNGSDGFYFGGPGVIENCNAVKNGTGGTGYGVDGSTNAGGLFVRNCGFGGGTMANKDGTILGNAIELGTVTYAADTLPWVDAPNGDFRPNVAAAKGAGRASWLQTASSYAGTVGYPDIGSAQHQETSPTTYFAC